MKKISLTQLEELAQQAALSARGRAHLNVHDSAADLVQRFFVAMEPSSYVRPHCHHTRAELLTVLRGRFHLLDPATAVEFAPWAPAEGAPAIPALLKWFSDAEVGQVIPK